MFSDGASEAPLSIILRMRLSSPAAYTVRLGKAKSITPHKNFMSEVYVLRKDEGGRHNAFFTGYRPQFYIKTIDVTGNIALPEGVEMVMPGDDVNLEVELIVPVALEQGSNFAIREGGHTVGAGVVMLLVGFLSRKLQNKSQKSR